MLFRSIMLCCISTYCILLEREENEELKDSITRECGEREAPLEMTYVECLHWNIGA